MVVEHLEISSTYRNRVQYPFPADFVAEIAQSGTKTAVSSSDPVCLSTPELVFTPFGTFTGIVQPFTGIGTATAPYFIILSFPSASGISHVQNYYIGAVLAFASNPVEYHRIAFWQYLQTIGGNDIFEVVVSTPISSTVQPGVGVSFSDPTSLLDTANPLFFLPVGISTSNFFINFFIFNQTRNQWLTINYYDGVTHLSHLDTTATSANYTPGTWTLGDVYVLRQALPAVYGLTIVASTTTSVTFPNVVNVNVGDFIRILNTNATARITNIVGNIVSVSPPFASPPTGLYEILPFTRDNENFLSYVGGIASTREAVCYEVELLNLVVPNYILNVSRGSRGIFYPSLYVQLTPVNSAERQGNNSLVSNNPNANRMLFRSLVNDTTEPKDSPFIRLDGNGSRMLVKMMPADSFHFSVHLPDGSIFNTTIPETYSPSPPNPLIQISALFALRRLS